MNWHEEHVKRIDTLTGKAQKIIEDPFVTSKNQKQLDKLIDWIAEECSSPDPEDPNYIRWLAAQPLSDPPTPSKKNNMRELDKRRDPDNRDD